MSIMLSLHRRLISVICNECCHGQKYLKKISGLTCIEIRHFSHSSSGKDGGRSWMTTDTAFDESESGQHEAKPRTNSDLPRNKETQPENIHTEEITTDLLELESRMRYGEHGDQWGRNVTRKRQESQRSIYNHGLPGLGKRRPSWVKKTNNFKVTGEIIFGLFPVLLALEQGHRQAHKLYTKAEFQFSTNPVVKNILQVAEEREVPIHWTSPGKLNELSQDRPHQGMCLDASKMKYEVLKDIPRITDDDHPQLWLVLHSVKDPMNFGAVLRSAYYLGVDQVLAVKKHSCALSPVVSKASAGALEIMRIHAIPDLLKFMKKQQEEGWHVIGTVGHNHDGAVPLSTMGLTKNTLLILGNEGSGIPEDVLSNCDQLITVVPRRHIHPGLDSLNVSVATGILLHHLLSTRPT